MRKRPGNGDCARPGSGIGLSPSKSGARGRSILGLAAFEKISAVEGILLDDQMRADLERIERSGMDELELSRFVLERYGKP